MKKLIIIPLLFAAIIVKCQNQRIDTDVLIVREHIIYDGDSMPAPPYGDMEKSTYDPNTLETDAFDYANHYGYYIDLDTTGMSPAYLKGRMYYDTIPGGHVVMGNDPESKITIGQESVVYGRNATGTPMTIGTVVYIDSSGIDPYPVMRRAIADAPDVASATIGVASHVIEPGTLGYITRFGGIDMNVSGYDENAILYVSPVDSGQLVDYAPIMPYYRVRVGRVIQPGNPGILGVDVEPFTGNDTEVALDGVLNGIILNKQSLRDTIISNVLYFETDNEDIDTIDLPFMYQNQIYLLNTTSGSGEGGRARVALTYGTATSAQTNYIYIDNTSDPAVLTANTTGYPVDGIRLAECGVFDQATHETFGFAWFQRFNNSINSSTADGLMNRSVKRQRLDGSKWEKNVDPTVSIIINPADVDSLKVETTSGTIWQFNEQTFQSQDGKRYLWLNSPTGERWIGHLGEIDSTADGIDLHGGNNRRYGLNILAIQNSGDFNDFLAVNAPLGYYTSDAGAVQDLTNFAVTTVPAKYGKVTVRLYRVVVNYSTGGNGTLTNLLGTGEYQDERGQLLGIGGGGGGSGSAVTNFSDADFTIYNSVDPTKIIDYDASQIATGNTRTITMPDNDVTLVDHDAIFTGASQYYVPISSGSSSYDYTIDFRYLTGLGLDVSTILSDSVYAYDGNWYDFTDIGSDGSQITDSTINVYQDGSNNFMVKTSQYGDGLLQMRWHQYDIEDINHNYIFKMDSSQLLYGFYNSQNRQTILDYKESTNQFMFRLSNTDDTAPDTILTITPNGNILYDTTTLKKPVYRDFLDTSTTDTMAILIVNGREFYYKSSLQKRGLTDSLMMAFDLLNDMRDGEIRIIRYENDTLRAQYGWSGNIVHRTDQLAHSYEHSVRRDAEYEKRINNLEELVSKLEKRNNKFRLNYLWFIIPIGILLLSLAWTISIYKSLSERVSLKEKK